MRPCTNPASKRRGRGYTMMEALISLLLLFIAVVGMGALAGTAVRTNLNAQQETEASFLAERLLGMMRTEALGWNNPTWNPASESPAANVSMPLLSKLTGTTGSTAFMELTKQLGVGSKAFNPQLKMVNPADPDALYCAHYKLTWLQPNESIRADVRVYWMRRGANPTPFGLRTDCGANKVVEMAGDITNLRCVARAAILSRNGGGV